MFRVTVQRSFEEGCACDVLCYADIHLAHRDSGWQSYNVSLYDEAGELVASAQLDEYPIKSDLWELIARGITTATVGTEQLPRRDAREGAAH